MESYKTQIEEKRNIVEAMTTEDTRKMKEMLYQRNMIMEFEKNNEKEMVKLKTEVESTLQGKQ